MASTACSQSAKPEPLSPGPAGIIEISTEPVDKQIDPAALPYRKDSPCPGLDSQLYQVTQSADPISEAQLRGLSLKEGKVQVLFELTDTESGFLLDYNVELGTQVGNQLQGYAPLVGLCELASLPQVLAIRLPASAVFP